MLQSAAVGAFEQRSSEGMGFESTEGLMLLQCVVVCCSMLQCVAVGAFHKRSGEGMRFESKEGCILM